jgi:putative transposase
MEFPFCRQPNVAGPAGPGRVPVGAAARRRADEALHRRPNIISPAPGHKIPPNCCEKLPTSRPNQVWAMDIATITPLGQRCASPDHCLAGHRKCMRRGQRDDKGAGRDSIFVERLWRTIKYEEVYPRAYASVPEARCSIGRYLDFCNSRRPHSAQSGKAPNQAYFNPAMPNTATA